LSKTIRETVLEPSSGWRGLDLADLWDHRDLVAFLIWRDVKVRYRQTFFGAAWAVVPPFVTTVVFTVVFGWLVAAPSAGLPYWAFSICALTIWTYFAQAMNNAGNSVINQSHLIDKVYFPRLALPLAAAIGGLIDLGIALVFMILALALGGILPTPRALVILPLSLIAVVTAIGMGSLLASINVLYRDVRHVLPLLVQLWLFATPVIYSFEVIPEAWRPWWGLNPMAGVVEGFRWAMLPTTSDPWPTIAVSAVTSVVMLFVGLTVFRRLDRLFADLI
jgi:lipopolysaccharide transport system permease protein